MQMSKSTSTFSAKPHAPGAEPGADPRRPSSNDAWAHVRANCSIQIVDYSESRATFLKADNQGLIRFLTSPEGQRPAWSKVRWINVGGVSWDVLSSLELKYDLHPLSVEDVLHGRRTSISKADYYTKHLFISTLCHTVQSPLAANSSMFGSTPPANPATDATHPYAYPVASPANTMYTYGHSTSDLPPPATSDSNRPKPPNWLSNLNLSRTKSHPSRNGRDQEEGHIAKDDPPPDDEEDDGVNWIFESIEGEAAATATGGPKKKGSGDDRGDEDEKEASVHFSDEARKQAANIALINELKGEDRVALEVSNLYIFLTRDGTVITIYKKTANNQVFGASILRRLRSAHTILRRSDDASLLVQAVLDYVVDKALEIVDKYHDRILKLERSVLIRPKMGTVREMHILSGDLTLHKRTLAPIKSLIYGLRRYDLDRCKALVGSVDPNADTDNVRGYMSHQAKIYMADVGDHMDYILESMDMFGTIAENLISYTFNTISYQTNETMRRLSLATIIFFPLTFLTGYFGMNFEAGSGGFWGVREHSDLFFWEIAIPMMAAFMLAWTWNDITRVAHVIKKRLLEREYEVAHRVKAITPHKRKTA